MTTEINTEVTNEMLASANKYIVIDDGRVRYPILRSDLRDETEVSLTHMTGDDLYYTQADEMGTETFVGTARECRAKISELEFAPESFQKYFSNDWNQKYPLKIDGELQHHVLVGADEAGYVVDEDGDFAIPLAEAVRRGWDDEQQTWSNHEQKSR